jgi:hypothetical protein
MDLAVPYADQCRADEAAVMLHEDLEHALRAGAWHDAWDVAVFGFRALVGVGEMEAASAVIGHLRRRLDPSGAWREYLMPAQFERRIETGVGRDEMVSLVGRGAELSGRELVVEVRRALDRHGHLWASRGRVSPVDGDPGREPTRLGQNTSQSSVTAAGAGGSQEHHRG